MVCLLLEQSLKKVFPLLWIRCIMLWWNVIYWDSSVYCRVRYHFSSVCVTVTEPHNTLRCRYNAVNFLKNIHKRHPIARPLGRGMGCLLWIHHLIHILPEFLQLFMQYITIHDRVITALHCTLQSRLSDWLWSYSLVVNCWWYFDELVQERRNSSALAMELCLSYTNPSI